MKNYYAHNSYEDAVFAAEQSIYGEQRFIFEDNDGGFHVITPVDRDTFNHYSKVNGWILRGRVFTETKVCHMFFGVEYPNGIPIKNNV